MTLGISKYTPIRQLTKKEEKRLIASATKQVAVKQGETLDVMFCQCCDLPVFSEDAYIGVFGDSDEPKIMCGLCYYPRNLDMIRFAESGSLIYAPDWTQEQVSALALLMYYVKERSADNQDMMDLVSDIDDLVLRRAEALSAGLCQGASTPSIVCQFFYMMDEDMYAERGNLFSSVRLFPSEKLASRQLAYLSTNVLKNYSPEKWVGLIQAINKEISPTED